MNTVSQESSVSMETKKILDWYLDKLIKEKTDGQISLDKIQKDTKLERGEIILYLRQSSKGVLIVGRKGATSRFAFGTFAQDFNKGHNYRTSRQNAPTVKLQKINNRNMRIVLRVGKHKIDIPIEAEVVTE